MTQHVVYTQAYNSEKTLGRTIESVLGQTLGDFVYYILDNGSRDGTGEIIHSYAGNDSRIVPLVNEENNVWPDGHCPMDFLSDYEGSWYFCLLDADDEYKAEFLEKATSFSVANGLDLAVCGSDFIDAPTGLVCGARQLDGDLVIEGDGFSKHFTQYHQFMRTIWGKLYSVRVLQDWPEIFKWGNVSYGFDTLFAQRAFRCSRRVGIMAEKLHRYYIFPSSASCAFDPTRVASDRILFDAAKDYLLTKTGSVSPDNEYFLHGVYLNAIQDTLKVLMAAKIPDHEKLSHVGYFKNELNEIQRYFDLHPRQPPRSDQP